MWKSVIREKIFNQKTTLEYFDVSKPTLNEFDIMVKRVKSGDPDNREALAARLYWKTLFGADFRRDRQSGAENSLLNYGYSILRAATARAICGAGLTPALGIHHRNRKNPFALVDDLMEPYRPLVDLIVRKIIDEGTVTQEGLTPEIKKELAKILDSDVQLEKGVSTVMNSLHRMAQTFVISLHDKDNKIEFPKFKGMGKLI